MTNSRFCLFSLLTTVFCSMAAFAVPHRFSVKIANYSGGAATDVPLLLRLSETQPNGFSYADTDGTDFVIKDSAGNTLFYEIGTWNPEGESTIWVKVPNFKKDETLTITYSDTTHNMTADSAEVWKNYVGVWHLDTTNGMDTANDNYGNFPNSTAIEGIDGQMAKRSTADADGIIGKSVMIADPSNPANLIYSSSKFSCNQGGVFIPDSGENSPLDLGNTFTISGWFKKAPYPASIEHGGNIIENPVFSGWDHLFYKREKSNNSGENNGAFALEMHGNDNKVDVRGASGTAGSATLKNQITEWTHLAFVYYIDSEGKSICKMYENGSIQFTSGSLAAPTDNNLPLCFGNNINGIGDGEGDSAWLGWIDEVRLVGKEMSVAEIQAEYAAMGQTDLLEYSDVEVPPCSLSIERNAFFTDDSVSVSVNGETWTEGAIPEGTTVTLTAVPGNGGTFRRWYGDVPHEDATKNPVTITAKGNMWIYCRIVHPWTLTLDDETGLGSMTDGNFTVNVMKHKTGENCLYVSHGQTNLLASTDSGTGILDLGGTITRTADGTIWTISEFHGANGSQCAPSSREGIVTGYISPGTVSENNIWGQFFHVEKTGAKYTNLIIFDEPNIDKFVSGDYFLNSQKLVKRLIFDLPLVKTLPSTRGLFRAMGVNDNNENNEDLQTTRFNWWNFPNVDVVSNMFFGMKVLGNPLIGQLKRCVGCAGNLSFPSLRGTDWLEDYGTQFSVMPNVESISLGGITEATTVTNLCFYSFAGNPSLRKLTLHASADIKIGSRIFADRTYNEWKSNSETGDKETEIVDGVEVKVGTWHAEGRTPDVIHFTGAAISENAIANLLDQTEVSTTIRKPVEIHASKWQPGWSEKNWGTPVSWLSEPTDAEKAAYAGEEILGVYRAGAEAPAGKAIVLHRNNEWDRQRRAFSIVIR